MMIYSHTRVNSRMLRQIVASLRARLVTAVEGTQLFELALVLPILLVLVVGVIDLSQGFILKQKLTNAARDGARIAIQFPPYEGGTTPSSVVIVHDAVVNYLNNADIDATALGSASPSKTGAFEWTYSSGGDDLIIDRGVSYISPNGLVIATRVTVRYPYSWIFSDVVLLIDPAASYSGTLQITGEVVMKQNI